MMQEQKRSMADQYTTEEVGVAPRSVNAGGHLMLEIEGRPAIALGSKGKNNEYCTSTGKGTLLDEFLWEQISTGKPAVGIDSDEVQEFLNTSVASKVKKKDVREEDAAAFRSVRKGAIQQALRISTAQLKGLVDRLEQQQDDLFNRDLENVHLGTVGYAAPNRKQLGVAALAALRELGEEFGVNVLKVIVDNLDQVDFRLQGRHSLVVYLGNVQAEGHLKGAQGLPDHAGMLEDASKGKCMTLQFLMDCRKFSPEQAQALRTAVEAAQPMVGRDNEFQNLHVFPLNQGLTYEPSEFNGKPATKFSLHGENLRSGSNGGYLSQLVHLVGGVIAAAQAAVKEGSEAVKSVVCGAMLLAPPPVVPVPAEAVDQNVSVVPMPSPSPGMSGQ